LGPNEVAGETSTPAKEAGMGHPAFQTGWKMGELITFVIMAL